MELMGRWSDLLSDQFGSQFFQRLLAVCNEDQKNRIIIDPIKFPYALITLCLNSFGVRAIANLMRRLNTPQQISAILACLTRGARSITVVFEGDLTHVVACPVKENDCVFVSDKLNVNLLRWLLREIIDKFHVLAANINFVAESENCALSEKMWASLPAVEIGELGNRNVGENGDSNKVLGTLFLLALSVEVLHHLTKIYI